MKFFKYGIFKILLTLNIFNTAVNCMTPSQSLAELMSSSVGSTSSSSSLSTLLTSQITASGTTSSNNSILATTSNSTTTIMPPQSAHVPSTNSRLSSLLTITNYPNAFLTLASRLHTTNPIVSSESRSFRDGESNTNPLRITPNTLPEEKFQILDKLRELGSSENEKIEEQSCYHISKKARIMNPVTCPEKAKNLSGKQVIFAQSAKAKESSGEVVTKDNNKKNLSSNQVFNIPDLINLISEYGISNAKDLAALAVINKNCSEMLNGGNLKLFLKQLNLEQLDNKNTYLDICVQKNYLELIDSYLSKQQAEIQKLKDQKSDLTGKIRPSSLIGSNLPDAVPPTNSLHPQDSSSAQDLTSSNLSNNDKSNIKKKSKEIKKQLIALKINYEKDLLYLAKIAAKYDNLTLLRKLIENYKFTFNANILEETIEHNSENCMVFLLDIFSTEFTYEIWVEAIIKKNKPHMLNKALQVFNSKLGLIENPPRAIFHLCIETNNIENLKVCLNYFNNLRDRNQCGRHFRYPSSIQSWAKGQSPLTLACKKNNYEMIKLLLERLNLKDGSLQNSMKPDINNNTPLSYAIENDNLELAKVLLLKGPMLSFEGIEKALTHVLLVKNDNGYFNRLLNLYPKYKTEIINKCLNELTKQPNCTVEAIEFLINEHKGDLKAYSLLTNVYNLNKKSPILLYLSDKGLGSPEVIKDEIFAACKTDSFESITSLLKKMDINSTDDDGNTVLFSMSRCEAESFLLNDGGLLQNKAVQFLLKMGANLEHINKKQQTPLNYIAKSYGWEYETLELFIKLGANANTKDLDNNNPLHNFIFFEFNENLNPEEERSEFEETIRLLINSGADVTDQNKDGNTPFHLYVLHGIVDHFIKFGEIDGQEDPVYYYTDIDDVRLINFIKLFIPCFNIKNNMGQTPIDIAQYLITNKFSDDDFQYERQSATSRYILSKIIVIIKALLIGR